MCASRLDPDYFVRSVLEAFHVWDWLTLSTDYRHRFISLNRDLELQLLEGALMFLTTLLSFVSHMGRWKASARSSWKFTVNSRDLGCRNESLTPVTHYDELMRSQKLYNSLTTVYTTHYRDRIAPYECIDRNIGHVLSWFRTTTLQAAPHRWWFTARLSADRLAF